MDTNHEKSSTVESAESKSDDYSPPSIESKGRLSKIVESGGGQGDGFGGPS